MRCNIALAALEYKLSLHYFVAPYKRFNLQPPVMLLLYLSRIFTILIQFIIIIITVRHGSIRRDLLTRRKRRKRQQRYLVELEYIK